MIAVVVPTIREECFREFLDSWTKLFCKHDVLLLAVHDGRNPTLEVFYPQIYKNGSQMVSTGIHKLSEEKKEVRELIYNKNDGVRNYGFYFVAQLSHVDTIITLDDDTKPLGDTIQQHLTALNSRAPISWINTASEYMRGFPYEVREEAEVVLSHGVWEGVKDWDAPTQLVHGNRDVTFFQGAIPRGIYYPMCGMNIAFKRKLLPYMYYAPMGYKVGLDRFADIWLGITSKRVIDKEGWAVVSGYARVRHERASNVWKNLQKEAKGLELNEGFWKGVEDDPYFKLYAKQRKRWEELLCQYC